MTEDIKKLDLEKDMAKDRKEWLLKIARPDPAYSAKRDGRWWFGNVGDYDHEI